MRTKSLDPLASKTGFWIIATVVLGCAAVAWQVSMELNEETVIEVAAQPQTELVVIPKADNLLSNELQVTALKTEQTKAPSAEQTPAPPKTAVEKQEQSAPLAEYAPTEQVVTAVMPAKPQVQRAVSTRVRSPAIESVKASASSDFFVQFIVLSDRVEAVNFVSRYPALGNALFCYLFNLREAL